MGGAEGAEVKIEADLDAWEIFWSCVIAVLLLLGVFLAGQSWRSNRAYCEAACYPVDVSACEHDFAVCWNDDRIRKIRRRK